VSKNRLPTVCSFTLDPDYSQGIIWKRYSDNQPEMEEGDELVRRKDVKNLVERTHGELVEKLQHLSDEEETGMTTLAQELIEQIEKSDSRLDKTLKDDKGGNSA